MKYYIVDEFDAPLYWTDEGKGKFAEFDTEEDAREFIKHAKKIPFLGLGDMLVMDLEIALQGSINLTGYIPVANGDSIDLIRR